MAEINTASVVRTSSCMISPAVALAPIGHAQRTQLCATCVLGSLDCHSGRWHSSARQSIYAHCLRIYDATIPFLPARSYRRNQCVAVIVPFESAREPSIDPLVDMVAVDMERVNATIIARTGSEVTMIPEVANHLINSGGKRLRPMLTLALSRLAGYGGGGHIKLAAAVEFMHTATLLHDDVVDESELRRGRLAARMLWGNEASVLVGDFLLGQAFKMM